MQIKLNMLKLVNIDTQRKLLTFKIISVMPMFMH